MNDDIERDTVTSSNLDLLKDIELPVTLRFGRTTMPLESLVRLNAGSIIEFESAADEPVELLVNGRLIARGEAVIVQNSYGIRISEIAVSPERIFPAGAAISESSMSNTAGGEV